MTEETNEMSDAAADAMVQAMLQSWKRCMDEAAALRIEVQQLKAALAAKGEA